MGDSVEYNVSKVSRFEYYLDYYLIAELRFRVPVPVRNRQGPEMGKNTAGTRKRKQPFTFTCFHFLFLPLIQSWYIPHFQWR